MGIALVGGPARILQANSPFGSWVFYGFFSRYFRPRLARELLVCVFWLSTCSWDVCWIATGSRQNGDFLRLLTTGFAAIGANKWFPIEFRNLRIFKAGRCVVSTVKWHWCHVRRRA